MLPALYPGRSRLQGEGVAAIGLMAIGGKDMPFDGIGARAEGFGNRNRQAGSVPRQTEITELDDGLARAGQFDAGEFEVQALREGQVQFTG